MTFIPFGKAYVSLAGTINAFGADPFWWRLFLCRSGKGRDQDSKQNQQDYVLLIVSLYFHLFSPFLLVLCRRRDRFFWCRFQENDRAIFLAQIFLCRFLNLFGRYFAELTHQKIDPRGIIIEQRKAG